MGLLDIFRSKPQEKFEALLRDLLNEANHKKPNAYTDVAYQQLENFRAIKNLPADEAPQFMIFLAEKAKADWKSKKSFSYIGIWYHGFKMLHHLLTHLEVDMSALEKIAVVFRDLRKTDPPPHFLPSSALLSALQRAIKKHGHTDSSRATQKSLLYDSSYMTSDIRKDNDLILFLLQDNPSLEVAEHDRWGRTVIDYLRDNAVDSRDAWIALFAHCKSGTGKSTPTAKWLKEAERLLENIGHEVFAAQLVSWLQHLQRMLQDIHKKKSQDFVREENHEIIKGLIWCTGIVNNASLNAAVEDYAVWAYKKLPGVGSLSVKTGTAAMFAFSMLPVKDGVARLSKFRTKIKNNSILKSIDKIMRGVSEKNGLSMAAMEELSVPDFGIKDGEITLTLENCIGTHSFDTGDISWLRGEKNQKSIPADIKEKFTGEIKSFKKVIKEAEEMLPVVKNRLEQSYVQQREWDFASWYKLYIEHELTSIISKKLIWHFTRGEQKMQGFFSDNGFVTANEEPISWLDASTKVQLWHPIGFSADKILEWRNFLRKHHVVQPFKQAYREVYIITDAELRTETYSNRYAAHILRQHQFAALLRQRGWHYTLQGTWDSHNTPYVNLPQWNLTAEYLVNAEWDNNEANVNASGVFNYVTTDQVRFIRDRNVVPLRDIPALVFSEIMRDVDLFVGVTSIGNDAAWQDGGDRFQNTYWREYSFSDLTASAKIRSEVLESLVPSLKIAPVCSFDKKFLIVKGKLRTYKIHMGSGNILMEPDDRYLCIVPESRNVSKTGEKVFLPFEGDSILSIIISKAFLLAEDDKIRDETITRQIRG